jgi:iron complex transport system substrate-binding protein
MKSTTKTFMFLLAVAMFLSVTVFSIPTLADTPDTVIDSDREGNPITLPESINTVISIAPSNTEILLALGLGDKIIATDPYSARLEGVRTDIPLFDMMSPDGEQIINLKPDILLVNEISKIGGVDPFNIVSEAGICTIYIPTSTSIDGIKEDIRFVATVMDVQSEAENIITEMEQEIETIRAIGQTITDKKSVYFEISSAPSLYSFGNGVFLDDMLDMIGAENIFSDRDGWFSITAEAVLDANPDVIITHADYLPDPVGEIMSRPGWEVVTAVQNGDVYYVDSNSSSRPSPHVTKALKQMAEAVYPGIFWE